MLKWLDTVRGSIFVDWESPDFEDARNESDDRRNEQSTIRTEFSNAQKSEVSRFRDGSELYETETEGSAWDISNHRSTIRWSAEFVANTTDTSILFRRRDTLRAMSSIIQIIWRYESTKRWDSQDDATKSVHILKSKSSIQRMIQIWCRDYDESYRTLSSYDSYYNDKINTHTISRRERDVTT